MGWYYYSGNVVRSVQVSEGKSVAVRPHTKVEIHTMTKSAQSLIGIGVLKKTGRPVGVVIAEPKKVEPEVKIEDVLKPSPLAQVIAEKGVTSSPSIEPKKPVGDPELTIHEIETTSSHVESESTDGVSKRSKRRRGLSGLNKTE